MSPSVLTALIAAGGVLGAATVTAAATLFALFWRRMMHAEATNRALWEYTRLLIDAIYRRTPPPPPAPPEHIKHLYERSEQ